MKSNCLKLQSLWISNSARRGLIQRRWLSPGLMLLLVALLATEARAIDDNSDHAKAKTIKPLAVDYSDLAFYPQRWQDQNVSFDMLAWEGSHVVLVTKQGDYDANTMTLFVNRLDAGWQVYSEMIGTQPKSVNTIVGKPYVCALPKSGLSCGYGCGYVGSTGIEVSAFYHIDLPKFEKQPESFQHYYFYEMGRNFFVFGDRASLFTTGYAVFMRYVCMDSLDLIDSDAATRQTIEACEDIYAKSDIGFYDAFTNLGDGEKHNRLKDEQGQSISPSDQPVMYATAMLKLRRDYGGDQWVRRFFQTLQKCDAAKATDISSAKTQIFNWLVCASLAARQDLSSLFADRWRLPLTANQRRIMKRTDWSDDHLDASAVVRELVVDNSISNNLNDRFPGVASVPYKLVGLLQNSPQLQGEPQSEMEITVAESRMATVKVSTDKGVYSYHLDNTGERDIAPAMQAMFDEVSTLGDSLATFEFLPGVYFIDSPITIRLVSLKLTGNGHGGLDVHGMNLKSGTIFRFGKNCGPNCLTFLQARHERSFPAGESPWPYQNCKLELDSLTFLGHNNTGVDTAVGYSRFRGDQPNFRGLHWYPAKDRYDDPEKQGQRAIVLPAGSGKNEMLRVTRCVFTELYVGVEAHGCDVSYITDSWFAQMTYGLRMRGSNPVCMIKNNCFADLETGVTVDNARMSNFNDNAFAYVSKCFAIKSIQHSTISNNVVDAWAKSTGAAAHGAFCYVGASKNLVMSGNSVHWELDARARDRSIDSEPNGRSLVHLENSRNLMFSNNVIDTVQSETVVRLHNATGAVVTDNRITFAKGGNAVATTGDCKDNFYRPLAPENSALFDQLRQD